MKQPELQAGLFAILLAIYEFDELLWLNGNNRGNIISIKENNITKINLNTDPMWIQLYPYKET